MRRVTKIAISGVATAALALSVSACGSDKGGSGSSKEKGVGLAYDVGGRGDQSFNDAAAAGFDKAKKEFGISGSEKEPKDGESEADKVQRLTEMARQGYNPVIGVGFAYASAIDTVAKKYPKTSFAVVDDAQKKQKNVANLVFTEEQGSYLMGVVAAKTTKTDTVGFIGGVDTPLIKKFEAGFKQGVKDTSGGKVNVLTEYITQMPDFKGFADPAGGKRVASGMLSKKADVIYPAAGGSGGGAFEAIKGKGNSWGLGVDSDQYKIPALKDFKEVILTSMLKNVEGSVFDFIKSVEDGKPQSGVISSDLKANGVGYSKSNPEFAKMTDVIKAVDEAKAKIASGEITVATEPAK
ncbi:BMP family lipoprotein [Streptomyces sp. NBC_01304]|uniref:BMP family lipoprotein n=1 Tax=Streptomyces sp. NBC_01304 TaxID=2903818 RepID=UPI002E11440D|nr:BMP family ABC transporter substrate-binding protein [Streptomyces sp. NBC_01304]